MPDAVGALVGRADPSGFRSGRPRLAARLRLEVQRAELVQADDLVGVGDRWQQCHLQQRYVRRRALHLDGGPDERAASDRGAQGRIAIAEPAPQIDDAVADDCAVRVTMP